MKQMYDEVAHWKSDFFVLPKNKTGFKLSKLWLAYLQWSRNDCDDAHASHDTRQNQNRSR